MGLKDNAFYILGVSMSDTKETIIDVSEAKSLIENPEVIEDARDRLLDTKKRISEELGWFPELSLEEIRNIINLIDNPSTLLIAKPRLNGISMVNYKLDVMSQRKYESIQDKDFFGQEVNDIVNEFDQIEDYDEVTGYYLLNVINQHRQAARIGLVKEEDFIDYIDVRREQIKNQLKVIMGTLPPNYLISSMTFLAVNSTENGEYRASPSAEALLELYELETQPFIEKQFEKIDLSIGAFEYFDEDDISRLSKEINTLRQYVATWQKVVFPIQISNMARGKNSVKSKDILNKMRDLSLFLNNDYHKPELAMSICEIVKSARCCECFPDLGTLLNEDIETLGGIINNHREAKEAAEREAREREKEEKEWERRIFYETELGSIFKDKLKITINYVEWNDRRTNINDIVGVSWGAISTTYNFFITKTSYSITIYTKNGQISMNPDETEYTKIIDHLWLAACIPLMTRMVTEVHDGKTITIGNIKFNDSGVYLTNNKIFSSDTKYFYWSQDVKISSWDGQCFIRNEEGNYSASASYINDMNTHVFEAMIRKFFKEYNSANPRISSLLYSADNEQKNNGSRTVYPPNELLIWNRLPGEGRVGYGFTAISKFQIYKYPRSNIPVASVDVGDEVIERRTVAFTFPGKFPVKLYVPYETNYAHRITDNENGINFNSMNPAYKIVIPAGAVIYLLMYTGEGSYMAWYNGILIEWVRQFHIKNYNYRSSAQPPYIGEYLAGDPAICEYWIYVEKANGIKGWLKSDGNLIKINRSRYEPIND